MTAKDKAKELVDKFKYESKHYLMLDAKRCALIAVDEVLKELLNDKDFYFKTRVHYYQIVKQEIKKL